MYKYETHLHTYPVSKCAKADIYKSIDFYKNIGYDGIFVTNHFLDGNINIESTISYEEKIEFYFSDYEAGVNYGKNIGFKVFLGVELSYKGTDFLVYGLNKEWYLKNPQIMDMKKSEELEYLMKSGALVIQAHPYREAAYIDHIRLFPRHVHGIEVINASRSNFENNMAKICAKNYNLLEFAGSDNHCASEQKILAGMCSETPIFKEQDFVERIKDNKMSVFTLSL